MIEERIKELESTLGMRTQLRPLPLSVLIIVVVIVYGSERKKSP
jgi:hypothetical protein